MADDATHPDERRGATPGGDDPAADAHRTSPRRLEAFTDGVFAIAATLLILDVGVDALGSGIHTDRELWVALGRLWPQLLGFGISFLILGALWAVHTRQFEHVTAVDGVVVTLNTIRLLGVVLVPFSTSLNSAYSDFLAGRLILPANFLLVTTLGAAQWFYVSAPRRQLLDDVSPALVRRMRLSALGGVVASVVVVAASPWAGSWAFLAFTLNRMFAVGLELLTRRRTTTRG